MMAAGGKTHRDGQNEKEDSFDLLQEWEDRICQQEHCIVISQAEEESQRCENKISEKQ